LSGFQARNPDLRPPMIRPPSLLSPWYRVLAGIVVLVAGLGGTMACAGTGYRDIAYFVEGSGATLAIVVEYRSDGSRSINLQFRGGSYGGPVFFHEKEWQLFTDNLRRVKGGAESQEQTFSDVASPGGGLLRMTAVRHGSEVRLTLVHQPEKGDSYPAVSFHLSPADFDNTLKAVVEAAKANHVVSAATAADFAQFRADLGARFTLEQLQDFEIAIRELELDAANRGKTTAAEQAADMRAVVNKKSFPDVVLLGWRARRVRILREFPEARRLIDQDTAEAAKTASTGTPEAVTRRLAAEKQALDKLRRDRDDTLRRLNELTQVIGRPAQ